MERPLDLGFAQSEGSGSSGEQAGAADATGSREQERGACGQKTLQSSSTAQTTLWSGDPSSLPQRRPATPQEPAQAALAQYEDLRQQAMTCKKCPLYPQRTHVVWGEGPLTAKLMLIGEAPGEMEDRTGRPFVGRAGQLLDRILEAAGFSRAEVFITNMVLCRPPSNRVPTEEEVRACAPYLAVKLQVIKPKVVVLLGATATRGILGPAFRITRDRGKLVTRDGIVYVPTFHPAALLRDPAKKRPVWEDFQKVRDMLRLQPAALADGGIHSPAKY